MDYILLCTSLSLFLSLSVFISFHLFFRSPSIPVPVFYLGNTDYHVDESDGYVEVQVWRTGPDLSKAGTVTVRSRKTDPVSAEGTNVSPAV